MIKLLINIDLKEQFNIMISALIRFLTESQMRWSVSLSYLFFQYESGAKDWKQEETAGVCPMTAKICLPAILKLTRYISIVSSIQEPKCKNVTIIWGFMCLDSRKSPLAAKKCFGTFLLFGFV